ncbi:hypothetical protein F5J12DRAFT_903542 [Pisolithus orientalis]|uniref:uncharacterized protein n=1 Tax=Pisolithus orientalis TaxID=936130 RepID=UPI00222535B5|nr:uncharacterized protein F5J12DRAFT_903542 [Pisolithus orientalis]KAI6028594.1 hypothetical protein F5J12DRAFT_903542 [Pisolithus orientalis]
MDLNVTTEKPFRLVSRLKKESYRALTASSTRWLSCLRRLNALLGRFDPRNARDLDAGEGVLAARPSNVPAFSPLPGPWGFLTSGYIVGLAVMVFRVRLVLRTPTLHFLGKSLLIWVITLAQTANKFSFLGSPWLLSYGNWVAHQEMATLCWSTFCSVCGVLCMEALTRGLEGGTNSGSPFNLFAYAFLLHIYSSPMTHGNKLDGLPSRPDKHVVFTIILPLLHLTIVHCLGIKQKWSNHRLIPSAVVSLLGLFHFHAVLWFSKSSYPLLNYMPCLFETILLSFIGSITRPLFGHHSVLLPKWEEDFSIALLRLGTASLEASVSALTAPAANPAERGAVELGRYGVTSVSRTFEGEGRNRRLKKGFANEIKCVKAASVDSDVWLDMTWCREFARFGVGVTRCVKGLYTRVWNFARGRSGSDDEQNTYDKFIHGEEVSDDDHDEFEPGDSSSRSPSHSSSSSPWNSADESDSQQETMNLYADLSSAVPLSTSPSHLLAHMADTSSTPLTRRRFSRMLSGHLATSSQNQTEDEWMEVIRARRPVSMAATNSSDSSMGSGSCNEFRHNCVICTVEPRQIICWPCRCFALCDDCRENLASRSSASKHMCPCCRRSVEGYSKIYIP